MANSTQLYGVSGQRSGIYSKIVLTTTAAASTNTNIRTFTTVTEITGYDMAYIKDAAAGDKIIIKTPGVYSFSFGDSFTANNCGGVSVNADPTVVLTSVPAINIITANWSDSNGNFHCAGSWLCQAGDVIRAHLSVSNLGANVTTHRLIAVRTA